MPFDFTTYTPAAPARSRSGVHLAELRLLVKALREPMPEGFEWDFTYIALRHKCGTVGCAVGLAQRMGLLPPKGSLSKIFGLRDEEISLVFRSPRFYGRSVHREVSRLQVADAIAAIIAREEADTLGVG